MRFLILEIHHLYTELGSHIKYITSYQSTQFCFGFPVVIMTIHREIILLIYLCSSGLFHGTWGNHMITPVSVKWPWSIRVKLTGGWINIKMPSYQYRKSHCGDKKILGPSYLHYGISYTGKTTSLYWIGALVSNHNKTQQSMNCLPNSWDILSTMLINSTHWSWDKMAAILQAIFSN